MRLHSKIPVFLVGCPRSGTTLLQSLLAAHPKIISFPESKFFQYLTPEYELRRQKLGLISQQLKPWLKTYMSDHLGRPDLLTHFPAIPLQYLYIQKFIKILSLLAEEQGKQIFLEKTPQHIFYINTIEKQIAYVKFIHLLRSGTDVVASLYDVTHRYPQGWDGKWKIDKCIDYWKQASLISLSYQNQPSHHLVTYENLTEHPEAVLKKICDFIGIKYDSSMIQNYSIFAQPLLLKSEGRSVNNKGICRSKSQKFDELFDEQQQQYILERLSQVNLETLNSR